MIAFSLDRTEKDKAKKIKQKRQSRQKTTQKIKQGKLCHA
jgi:hypothetical protein